MTETTKYTLKHPITTMFKGPHGEREETVTEVAIRRATAADLRLMDQYQGKPIALTLAMIGALSDLLPPQIEKLDADDVGPLGELVVPG